MSWQNLRTDVKTLLDSISGIHQISSPQTLDFSGYPAVTIVEGSLGNETETSRENLRSYVFVLHVFYPANQGVDDALENVRSTVDAIIDKIDEEEKVGNTRTVGASLGSDYQILSVKPVIGPFDYNEDTDLAIAQLALEIQVSYFLEA